ncbi:MAG: hypothetical protein R3C14_36255 [Caldilineaceae bacterium]
MANARLWTGSYTTGHAAWRGSAGAPFLWRRAGADGSAETGQSGGTGRRLHLGVQADFQPARKAHPALLVEDLTALIAQCEAAGHPIVVDEPLPGYHRVYTADPFGNRIELMEPI